MGVQITELLPIKEAKLEDFGGKIVAIDAANHLYQFLSSIRSPDGSAFTNSDGNVTSHLIGLFSRTTHMMKLGIKPVYVFDGKVPDLKKAELLRRKESKMKAVSKYEDAKKEGDEEEMRKYASRTVRLTPEMIKDAKEVIEALGLSVVQATGEGEAQASRIVAKEDAFAVASQDSDSLLFGATRLVRNLSIAGKKKKTKTLVYEQSNPEMIKLSEVLSSLGIDQKQLICLSMIVGTDYNPGGIKGIGPKGALKLVKEQKTPDKILSSVEWSKYFDHSWQDVFELFTDPPVTDDYEIKFSDIDNTKATELLCGKHGFSEQRVNKTLKELEVVMKSKKQKGLGEFFS
jgi:flap endonuclease-1